MVQCRAARFVTGDWRTTSRVTALIKTLQWQTREQRIQQSRLIFLHKYCHKPIDITEPIAIRARAVNNNYQAINSCLWCYNNSFAPSTVREWNKLPPDTCNETDTMKFKTKLLQLINYKHELSENDSICVKKRNDMATISTLFDSYNIHFVWQLQYPLCLTTTISTLFDNYNIHFVWQLQYPLCLTTTISTLFDNYNIHFVWQLQYPLCLTTTISTLFDSYNIHFV